MRRIVIPLALAFVAALLAVGAQPVGAGPAEEARPDELIRLPLPETLDHQDDWYGIYMHGTKSGYAHAWTRRIGEGEGSRLLYAMEVRIEVQAMGQKVVMVISERSQFDGQAPYAFLSSLSRHKDPENEQTIRVQVEDGRLVAVIEEAGIQRTIERDGIDYTFEDFWTPQTWIQQGRGVGDRLRVRSFDSSTVESDVDILEVLSKQETVAGGVPLLLYDLGMASKRDGDEGTAVVDADGRTMSMKFADMFELRLESEEVAKQLEIGGDLFLLNTVPIDRPIGDAPRVRRLVVEVAGDFPLESGPRQSVHRDPATGRVTLSLGAMYGEPLAATPASIERNLEETVEFPIRHAAVKAIAAKAVGDAATPREKVERLVRFVDTFVEDAVLPNASTVMGLVERPRGDCSEHTLLFTALARSLGIPARDASGLMYMGDKIQRFGGHVWNEVVLDGFWVPVDATWGQVEIDATHITLARGDDPASRRMRSQTDMALTLKAVEAEEAARETAPSR